MDLEALARNYRPTATAEPEEKKKKGNQWVSAVPSVLAAGASLIPGVGTVGAAALGAGGELLRQKMSGEDFDLGKAGQEAALSAIPGGLGKVAKLARGAKAAKSAKAATRSKKTEDAADGAMDVQKGAESMVPADSSAGPIPSGPAPSGPALAAGTTPRLLSAGTYSSSPQAQQASRLLVEPSSVSFKDNPAMPRPSMPRSTGQSAGADALPAAATEVPAAQPIRRSSLLDRMQGGDRDTTWLAEKGAALKANNRGIRVGDKIPGTQDVLDRQKAEEINAAIDLANRGARPASVRSQLERVQFAKDDAGRTIGELTKGTNLAIGDKQIAQLSKGVDGKLGRIASYNAKNPAPADARLVETYSEKIAAANNLDQLEAVRRSIDDDAKLLLRNPDAKGTKQAQIAKAYRDAIDDFVSGVNPQLKAAKTQYRNLSLAEDLLAKKADPKGIAPFGTTVNGNGIGGGTMQAVQDGAGKVLEAAGSNAALPTYGRSLIGQLGVRAPGAVMADPAEEAPVEDPATAAAVDPATGDPAGTVVPEADPTDEMYQQFQQAMMNDLQTTGGQNVDKILKVAAFMGVDGKPKQDKPLSAEASKVIANANSGLGSLDDLEAMIASNPEVLKKTVIPGRGLLGGLVGNAAGTAEYDTLARNIADVITRLRTGAALTEAEEAHYRQQLPQAFDSPEVIQQKLAMFRELFSSVANRTGSAGTDTQAAVGA